MSIKLISKICEVVIAVSAPTEEVSTIQVFLPKHDTGNGAGCRGRFETI